MFIMLIAPILTGLFFADILKDGLPKDLPISVVDMDNSSSSRALLRSIDNLSSIGVQSKGMNFSEARKAMQKGDIYGIWYIPKDFTKDATTSKQPRLDYYSNMAYFLPGSLVYRDMRTQSTLGEGAISLAKLKAMGKISPFSVEEFMPIKIDAAPLNNPWLSYSIYLVNIMFPGIIFMFVMFTTSFSIAEEVKQGTSADWIKRSKNSVVMALAGKLIPHTIIFFVVELFCLAVLYRFLGFPINSGIFPMLLAMFMLIISAQTFALFITGIVRRNRIALSVCSLWGVMSFSISGFTFPVRSMPQIAQTASDLFQMRHYYLIYVDQALNGLSFIYSWKSYMALAYFCCLPLIILPKFKEDMLKFKYLK